uniref:NB-ARC domain-containing protein n=1 Tax=Arundo donax TaxID=35708 RepID=A0A0A9DH30_ARUDO
MFAKAIRGILYSAFTQKCLDDTVGSKLTEILRKPDNHLHHLLSLSHGYLHPNQKMCLSYCSMFPRDYTYDKEKLLRLWMSQGFIIPEKEKHGHDNCEDAFDELLHGPFFDYSPSDEAKEQKYVMHELSFHLAWSASGNKFFRAHDHELHCIPKDTQHLSVIPKQCDSEIYFSSFTEFRELSTLVLVYNSRLESTDSQFHVLDVKALDECLRNFRYLKTLDLSHTDIRELPESIGYVTSLCFLGLNNTNIRILPNSVCNLINLQTLELQNSAYLEELPNDIKNLNSLYHLDASKQHGAIYVPPGIGQLTNLRTLTTFTVGGVSWNCKVSELAHLNSLKGSLHIRSLNNVENVEDAMGACLATKKLKKLLLEWCHSGEDVESDDRISVAEHVLDALKPHGLLEELNIKGYYGLEFPSWMTDRSLSDLVSITLDDCYNCEKLPPLGVLPVLRCLFIQNLRGVQIISCEFCTTGTINHKGFPKLQILKLRDMYNLECWDDVMDGDFSSLRSLSIERCPKLKSIPRFQFISDISVMSCSKLNLPGIQSLRNLKIGDLKQRKCFALPCELHLLLMLEVTCCEHLCSVEGLSRLQSLKHLKFRACPRLNFIQDEPLPETVETVDIHRNCYALSNWRLNGFEELPDASEAYRKFVRRKCKGKRVDDAVMQWDCSISTVTMI